MADEDAEKTEGEEQESTAKGGNKKLIFILAGIIALLLVGGGAAYFFLLSGGDESANTSTSEGDSSAQTGEVQNDAPEPDTSSGDEEEGDDAPTGAAGALKQATSPKQEDTFVDINFGATYQLKPFHSNLGNPLENRYLRLEIAFEYKQGDEQRKEIEARLPQLRDAVLSVASRKTREFLLGPDGKDQLRLEILNRVNQFMDKKIESIFITDMLIE